MTGLIDIGIMLVLARNLFVLLATTEALTLSQPTLRVRAKVRAKVRARVWAIRVEASKGKVRSSLTLHGPVG